jgi:hypothetical protein
MWKGKRYRESVCMKKGRARKTDRDSEKVRICEKKERDKMAVCEKGRECKI